MKWVTSPRKEFSFPWTFFDNNSYFCLGFWDIIKDIITQSCCSLSYPADSVKKYLLSQKNFAETKILVLISFTSLRKIFGWIDKTFVGSTKVFFCYKDNIMFSWSNNIISSTQQNSLVVQIWSIQPNVLVSFNKFQVFIHWEKNAIESKAFLSIRMYTRTNKYVTNSISYWFESVIYMLLERNAIDSIAFFSQYKIQPNVFFSSVHFLKRVFKIKQMLLWIEDSFYVKYNSEIYLLSFMNFTSLDLSPGYLVDNVSQNSIWMSHRDQ